MIFRHTRMRKGTRCNYQQKPSHSLAIYVPQKCSEKRRNTLLPERHQPARQIRKSGSLWNVRSVYTIFSGFCFAEGKPPKGSVREVGSMGKDAHPDELNDGLLADYPSGCDPATRVTAGIQETWEIHPSEEEQAEKEKKPKKLD
jgi:hypothetical protein